MPKRIRSAHLVKTACSFATVRFGHLVERADDAAAAGVGVQVGVLGEEGVEAVPADVHLVGGDEGHAGEAADVFEGDLGEVLVGEGGAFGPGFGPVGVFPAAHVGGGGLALGDVPEDGQVLAFEVGEDLLPGLSRARSCGRRLRG